MTDKFIDITKLKPGNKILLETKECIYDINIVNPATGDIMISGGKRFNKSNTLAKIIGVYGRKKIEDKDTLLMKNAIEQNIGVEITYKDNDNIVSNFITSPILSAQIYGENWHYEIWESPDKSKILEQSLEEARARLRLKTPPKEDTDSNENTLS